MPCIADDDGHPCFRATVMSTPIALCAVHRAQIALIIMPDLLREVLANTEAAPSAVPPLRADLVTTASVVPADTIPDGVHESVVYFLSNGGRIKIGYTTNVRSRIAALSLRQDDVLLLLHGGPDLERALHAHFDTSRHGTTEWFDVSRELLQYITDRLRRPGGSKRRATASKITQPETAGHSTLADVLAVTPEDTPRVWNQVIAERLAELNPETYAGWQGETVTTALKALGIHTRDIAGRADGRRTTRRGVMRDDIVAGHAREQQRFSRTTTSNAA